MARDAVAMNEQVALITGASRGLGREVARAYARLSLRLIVTARGAAALDGVTTELRQLTDVLALPGDVANAAHAERLVRLGLARFGHIDVLINNASELGPTPMPELVSLPVDEFERVLGTNVVAPLRLVQLVVPAMRARGGGLIVNVS